MTDSEPEKNIIDELIEVFRKHNRINGSEKKLRKKLGILASKFNGKDNQDWIEVANNTVPDHVPLYKDRRDKRQTAREYYNEFLAQYMVPLKTHFKRDYSFYNALKKECQKDGNITPGDILIDNPTLLKNIAMQMKEELGEDTHMVLKAMYTNRKLILEKF